MSEKAKPAHDAFTFSLAGMRVIASFTVAPAIADDRINKTRNAEHRVDDRRRVARHDGS